MRKIAQLLAIALCCGALFSAAFVGAQDATTTPSPDATMEATSADMTAEATAADMTMEATASTNTQAQATAMPTTDATTASTTTSTTSTTQTGSTGAIVCDSDLILNLYVAERYFGFDGVMSAAMNSGTSTSSMVDVTTLDKGQFASLFAAPMTTTPTTTMTQDQMQAAAGMMTMDQTTMMSQMTSMMPAGTDMSSMTTLNSASVPGEDAACTTLRTELNRFYTILAFQGMQSSMGTGSGMEATAEATAEGSSSTGSTTTASGTKANFGATLAGANEVPGPGDSDATGKAAITVDAANQQICYNISVQNITLPAMAAHIHRGAAGESGPIVVPFDVAPDASGNAVSCVKVDPALLNEIATKPAGFYVNVHTSDFPDGAARGQLAG